MKTLKPILKWAGGKKWLAPRLYSIFFDNCGGITKVNRYVDMFAGGLYIPLLLNFERCFISDINRWLINLYEWMRLSDCEITINMKHDGNVYYANRARFNELAKAVNGNGIAYEESFFPYVAELAQLFYYLNRTGFNGLCRFNSSGEFNVPFGKYSKINYATQADFLEYKNQFKNWKFRTASFEIMKLETGDFVYADPPYDDGFTSYSTDGFSWKKQLLLADKLAIHNGPVVASNKATERILELYRRHDFVIELLDAPRHISRDGDGRKPVKEMLAFKNVPLINATGVKF